MAEWNKNKESMNPALSMPVIEPSLKTWGNNKTMNINNLVLTNIQNSHYFKTELAQYHCIEELVDQIYYKVTHLEPWERGTRKISGQFGVGAGGVVSSAYCILYKMFLIKPTKNQIKFVLNHRDSPYIRGVGFMFIRYCLPPDTLWKWFERYINDQEEIDPSAGGGHPVTIGSMLRGMLTDLDWFGTLFPRIPLPIQKQIDARLEELNESSKKHDKKDRESRKDVHKSRKRDGIKDKSYKKERRPRSRSRSRERHCRHRNHSPIYKRPRSP